MFVVRRTTPTGGSSQYLVESVVKKGAYSWQKVAKVNARLFTRKSSASRLANTYMGVVTEL